LPPPIPAGQRNQIDAAIADLKSPDERVRAEAAVQLGRLKANRAVESLTHVLNQDRSPQAREAAARALGLIGDSDSLSALQRAAQADDNRDVRHSASFAADVIRSHLSH
jgi:HEAT repeat protein